MRTAILILVVTALAVTAGSATALPPRYFANSNNGTAIYPVVSNPYVPGYYPAAGTFQYQGFYPSYRSRASYGNPNRGYPGVTNFGPSSGAGALHPAPMSWQFANPNYRRLYR